MLRKSACNLLKTTLETTLNPNKKDVWEEVNKTGDWNDDLEKKYTKILDGFMKEGSF